MSPEYESLTKLIAGVELSNSCLCVEHGLRNFSGNFDLMQAVTEYAERCPNVDWELIKEFLYCEDDPILVGFTIGVVNRMRQADDQFWLRVLEISRGVEWDEYEDARLQAVLNLSRAPVNYNDTVKEVLKIAFNGNSKVIKDASVYVAAKITEDDVWPYLPVYAKGDLINLVSENTRFWLIGMQNS